MKKKDIIADGTTVYAYQRGKYGSPRRIVVVENETYNSRRMNHVSERDLREDEAYVAAHLAYSEAEAFPQDVTPRERNEVRDALREATHGAQRRWFEADPMRQFVKTTTRPYRSRWESSDFGILCKTVLEDGTVSDGFVLVDRKDIRSTWADHEAAVKTAEEQYNDERKRQAEYQAKVTADRERFRATFEEVFGISPDDYNEHGFGYIPNSTYDRKVDFTFEQADALIRQAFDRGKVIAALAMTKKEGQPA